MIINYIVSFFILNYKYIKDTPNIIIFKLIFNLLFQLIELIIKLYLNIILYYKNYIIYFIKIVSILILLYLLALNKQFYYKTLTFIKRVISLNRFLFIKAF